MCMYSGYQKSYCAQTEQGDLGLGAEVLNENDQKTLYEYDQKHDNQQKEQDKKDSDDK